MKRLLQLGSYLLVAGLTATFMFFLCRDTVAMKAVVSSAADSCHERLYMSEDGKSLPRLQVECDNPAMTATVNRLLLLEATMYNGACNTDEDDYEPEQGEVLHIRWRRQ